ncbi:alpha/beta fold hydrolase [Falsiruegeria mediterranea]|uniref:2-succinyl-6-hydroxy-2, 4-cyclohexadiene-1-carboxylate synthase n=1 Tax=Falsiruegeria mediterranea M17 TaxID=1200281 RepID=A0A2R8C3X9_9RHOB|nr:alpha/beta hydrolase [Falsiruegeria mediterranea]SPJ27144.1 2-succinyl-6-hydroxy-2, 4-cyclohexadiene-1-carboxylate synthase [Falsiruegeria mediterranea M17]
MFEWSLTPSFPMKVNGVALEYACHGPAPDQAPTIVLLHEGLGCVALWRDFPEKLSARTGFGVLVFSRQGYGNSDPIQLPRRLDYQSKEPLEVLPHIMEQADIQRCILFGHSDGATMAAAYAGSVEDHRVRGVILMAPHFFAEPMGLAEIERARDTFNTTDLSTRMSKYHRDPEGAFRGWADVWLDPGFADWNVAEVIDYIRVPILAIQGHGDQYGTMAQLDEITDRAYCPVGRVELDCKHSPHLEASEETLAAAAEFCARLERIEAAQVETA